MRDWITVLIILLILGVLLDGMRRMRAHRRNHLRMQRKIVEKADVSADEPVENLTAGEFPSGGARVAGYRDPDLALNINKTVKENLSATRQTRGILNRERTPQQTSLKLDSGVPMLMDSVEDADREPSLGSYGDLEDDNAAPATQAAPSADVAAGEKTKVGEKPTEVETPKAPDVVLVVNVMAHKGEMFSGQALLDVMVEQGLRYGEMDIFHRHESADGRGRVLFSAANLIMPGTFDLIAMDDFNSPGISFFLTLPIASDSLSAFNLMIETAQAVAEALGGEMRDENRSVMTRQTIEHGRQRVLEYERKRRLAKV
jgi:cell division protein ZipA